MHQHHDVVNIQGLERVLVRRLSSLGDILLTTPVLRLLREHCPTTQIDFLTKGGKANTQKIESKHINLRTRIKRLVRRTICFSKTERMHDLVIGLFINRYEFGVAV